MCSTRCGILFFFFSSRRRHTRSLCDWSSDVCSSDLQSEMFPSAQHDSYSQVVPLQQTHLCVFGHGVGKTHAKADETHRFSCAAEGFFEQSAKIFQCRRKARALGGRTCEIVELQFYENLRDVARRFFLS